MPSYLAESLRNFAAGHCDCATHNHHKGNFGLYAIEPERTYVALLCASDGNSNSPRSMCTPMESVRREFCLSYNFPFARLVHLPVFFPVFHLDILLCHSSFDNRLFLDMLRHDHRRLREVVGVRHPLDRDEIKEDNADEITGKLEYQLRNV